MPAAVPRISIVTPCFNQAEFLERTLDSVLSQGYPNLEYVVVDGGSTDGSVEIIRRHERHLHAWVSEPDQGHYDAVNKGFRRTTGDVMAWLNGDDLYFSFCLRTVGSIFSELPSVEWLTSAYAPTWDAAGFCIDVTPFKGFAREAFVDGANLPATKLERKAGFRFIQQESTFWRRSLWERAGGAISLERDLAGDFDLWSRFYRFADLHAVTSPLGGFRQRAGQRSEMLDAYVAQARGSLAELRAERPRPPLDVIRGAAARLGCAKIPLIGNGLRSVMGYVGKRVVRREAGTRSGHWAIQEHKFL